jgi:hypothetical protein
VTNTVSATLNRYFLSSDRVVTIRSSTAIHDQDRKNVLYHGFLAIGCALGGLDVLRGIYQSKGLDFLDKTREMLEREVNLCRQKMLAETGLSFKEKLYLRGRAIDLAGSGAANALDHPAGRIYREALMFSVSGQTIAVMETSLQQLLCPSHQCYDE